MSYIGLDIGGTKIEAVLLEKGSIRKATRVTTDADKGREATLEAIRKATMGLMQKGVQGIGIGIAGRTDPDGKITFTPNIPLLAGVNLKKLLETGFGVEARIENDSACFALAENRLGAGRGTRNMTGLVIGTGIGAGIIIEGKLYKGSGEAGEIGHMVIDPSGMRCGCGKKGDLESWCSGRSITRRYIKAGGRMKEPNPSMIWKNREPTARRIMDETIEKLGTGISNIINAYDPEMIVIGGGVGNLPFYDRLRREAGKNRYFGQKAKTRIEKAQLKEAGAIGAALLMNSM